jgi:putative RNA 2'-phosphotransferase
MNAAAKTKASKQLSYILRHRPDSIGLTLDEAGWGSVDDILAALNTTSESFTLEQLQEVVYTNTKKRFEFDETHQRIRARQGHSIDVDLGYQPIEPPRFLYHGTPATNLESILTAGIDKRARHHVHMSTDKQVMLEAAARRGKPTLIQIKTENQVWLTEFVPPKYCTHQHPDTE